MNGTTFAKESNAFFTKVAVRKWGNSQGIRLSKEIISRMGLKENDEVIVDFCGERQATILKVATLCKGDDKYNLIMAMAGDVQLQRIKAIVKTPNWSYDDDKEEEKEDE